MENRTLSRDAVCTNSNALYDRVAGIYTLWVRIGSFWAFPKLYKIGSERLSLSKGHTVFDICCGTGEMFPYIQEKIGPEGKIIGCDLSSGMLRSAEKRCNENGWDNVSLINDDANNVEFDGPVDAIIFSICLSAIPWYQEIIEKTFERFPSGTPVLIIDSLYVDKKIFSNLYNKIKGKLIKANPDCGLKKFVEPRLSDFTEEHYGGAVYTLISGKIR